MPDHVQTYRVFIEATPDAIWQALTDGAWTARYGYCVPVEYDLRPGGAYAAPSTDEMIAMGAPPVMVDGEVREVDAPRRLVQTWRALFGPETAAEPAGTLTFTLVEGREGVTSLTLEHDLAGAPITAAVVGGHVAEAGGGWAWVLSDLKSLLERGTALPQQMG